MMRVLMVWIAFLIPDYAAAQPMQPIQYVQALPSGMPAAAAGSSDGRFLYVAEPLSDRIVVYGVGGGGRDITPLWQGDANQTGMENLRRPWQLLINHGGDVLYVLTHGATTTGGTDALLIFSRDSSNGSLLPSTTLTQRDLPALQNPSWIAVSPDDAFLYISASGSLLVLHGGRSAPESVQTLSAGQAELALLAIGGRPLISHQEQGVSLYVADSTGDSVLHFERAPQTGKLLLRTIYDRSRKGYGWLQGISGMALAGDDRNLYIAAAGSGTLGVLYRDAQTGDLLSDQTYQGADFAGERAADSVSAILRSVTLVEVSRDKDRVYLASSLAADLQHPGTLTSLRRNPLSGELHLSGYLQDNVNEVDALNIVMQMVEHPAGDYLYSAAVDAFDGQYSGKIGVFSVDSRDLSLSVTADLQPAVVEQSLHLHIFADNLAAGTATTAAIAMAIPDELQLQTVNGGECTIAATVTCELGDLPAHAGRHIDVQLVPRQIGEFSVRFALFADQKPESSQAVSRVVGIQVLRFNENQPPHAVADAFSLLPSTALEIDVLRNDGDPDGDRLVIQDFTPRSQAGAYITSSGDKLLYLAPPKFLGWDEFRYSISDGRGGAAVADVLVLVDTPPRSADDRVMVLPGHSYDVYAATLLMNDMDNDGDAIALTSLESDDINHGVLTGKPGDELFEYTPSLGFVGIDTFRYRISDAWGAGSVEAVVSLLVDNPPTARDDVAVTEVGKAVTIAVLANDEDVDGGALQLAGSGGVTVRGGVVTRNTAAGLVYTPPADFIGTDDFIYTVEDEFHVAASARVTVQVTSPSTHQSSKQGGVARQRHEGGKHATGLGAGNFSPLALLWLGARWRRFRRGLSPPRTTSPGSYKTARPRRRR